MKLLNDKFRKARGGYSRFLSITCQKCDAFICHYQKDGLGNLRRMYLDRILESKVSLTRKDFSCPKGHMLGVKIIYEKEKRPAFRLFVDSVIKRLVKA